MLNLSNDELKVIKSIFTQEHPTRISLSQKTKMSLVKISSILSSLEKKDCIMRAGKIKPASGRPSCIFKLHPELGYTLGVSIFLDSFRIVAMDCSENLIYDELFSLQLAVDSSKHIDNIINQVSGQLRKVIESRFPDKRKIMAICLSLPGMVDTRRGIWLLGLQVSGITHINIAQILEKKLKFPVFIENSSRSLAFLEMHTGYGKGIRNFVLVYLGLGMGTGIVFNRRIYRGFHGLAGEIGHIVHADNTFRCSCNSVGCLETVVSATGIMRVFRERLKEGVMSSLQQYYTHREEDMTLEVILEAARKGDRLAQSTLSEIGSFLGDACAVLIKLFNPQRIIISGHGAIFKDYFREPVQNGIAQQVFPEMLIDYKTVFADYEKNHEAYGAALIAAEHYWIERLKKEG